MRKIILGGKNAMKNMLDVLMDSEEYTDHFCYEVAHDDLCYSEISKELHEVTKDLEQHSTIEDAHCLAMATLEKIAFRDGFNAAIDLLMGGRKA
jgi:hypothetical protein